jgi:hypothetical protein
MAEGFFGRPDLWELAQRSCASQPPTANELASSSWEMSKSRLLLYALAILVDRFATVANLAADFRRACFFD